MLPFLLLCSILLDSGERERDGAWRIVLENWMARRGGELLIQIPPPFSAISDCRRLLRCIASGEEEEADVALLLLFSLPTNGGKFVAAGGGEN